MDKQLVQMRAGKAWADHTEKNTLIPRLNEDSMIWMMKTKDGYKPAIRFEVAR